MGVHRARDGSGLLRPLGAVALAAPLLLLGAGASDAADEPLAIDDLPTLTASEIADRRMAIDVRQVESIDVREVVAIDVPEIETFEPEVEESGGETVVSLQTDVLFRFGESELTSSATKAVAEAVAELPENAEVAVVGHTDSIGSDQDNQQLSKERAEAVATVIEAERSDLTLEVNGKGESDPVAPNRTGGEDDPDGREQNRRVELRYAS